MQKIKLFILLLLISVKVFSQEADSTNFSIDYSSPKEYTIAGLEVQGIRYLDTQVLLQISGLNKGDKIMVPGDAITNAVKRFWKQGLFSDVKIYASKIVDGKVWLNIALKQRPRVSEINYKGLKKGEIEDGTEIEGRDRWTSHHERRYYTPC